MATDRDIFPPAPRFAYWYLSVMCIAAAAYVGHEMGLWRLLQQPDMPFFWDLLMVKLLLPGFILFSALYFLLMPLRRTQIEVDDAGLVFIPNGGPTRRIPWTRVERITRYMGYRRPDFLEVLFEDPETGQAGRQILQEDLIRDRLADVLQAVETQARRAGYTLRGHPLDGLYPDREAWHLEAVPEIAKGA